ncbi:MAG TPA: BatA domain-containing protein, partial [Planctomycetaceae bacterium]|nr:BatA domain-containing protein [Planctomycetaceae bacterium]
MSVFHLLALGFATPTLLGWLALAAVPVLIHWLFRRRYREVTWAAMQFLHEAARQQSRRMRLEQLLLLAARIFLLVLIVFALARPQWADANKLAKGTPPTFRVLLIDASLSMGRAAQESAPTKTLFDVAQGAAREVVRRSASGDRFVLARIAGSEPRVLIRQPTLVASAVLEELDRLPLTFERGDVEATLSELPDVMNAKLPHERGEIVVISDFQADNWLGVIPKTSEVSQTSEVWHRLADKAAIVLIDVGPAEPDNATVLSIATDPPILSAEQPMSVTATIRNNGTAPIAGRRVELLIDDQLVDSKRIDLPLGQDSTVEFTLATP